MAEEKSTERFPAPVRFLAWVAVGVLFMIGVIAPIGFVSWIPAAILGGVLIALKIRSPRYFFPFVTGIGATLVALGIVNGTYVLMLLYGTVLIAGGIVFFAAFGPRTSHADPP